MTTEVKPTDIELWEKAHAQLSPAARERFEIGEMITIRRTVAPDLSPPEFQMMMAMAGKYDLDPLAHEIWGVKSKKGRVLILVGRDGLLKVARRDRTYAGQTSDVVREKDAFRVKRSTSGGTQITHEYEGGPEQRGKILGAYCLVHQKGMADTYFFAPWEEYHPGNADSYSPWTNQPSVMICKCALAVCLRLAFNLAGVLAEEEAAKVFDSTTAEILEEPRSLDGIIREMVPPLLQDRFLDAWAEAIRTRRGMLTRAAVEMALEGRTPEEVEAYIAQVEADNKAADEESKPPVVDAESVLEEQPQGDAEQALEARLTILEDRLAGAESTRERDTLAEEMGVVEGELRMLRTAAPGEAEQ